MCAVWAPARFAKTSGPRLCEDRAGGRTPGEDSSDPVGVGSGRGPDFTKTDEGRGVPSPKGAEKTSVRKSVVSSAMAL